jgi:hypothetical protein
MPQAEDEALISAGVGPERPGFRLKAGMTVLKCLAYPKSESR